MWPPERRYKQRASNRHQPLNADIVHRDTADTADRCLSWCFIPHFLNPQGLRQDKQFDIHTLTSFPNLTKHCQKRDASCNLHAWSSHSLSMTVAFCYVRPLNELSPTTPSFGFAECSRIEFLLRHGDMTHSLQFVGPYSYQDPVDLCDTIVPDMNTATGKSLSQLCYSCCCFPDHAAIC